MFQELVQNSSQIKRWPKQYDHVSETSPEFESKGALSPLLGTIGLVRPRVGVWLSWDARPPSCLPPLRPSLTDTLKSRTR